MNPPVLRAPNGVVQDGLEFFSAGKPYYDPAKITAPTLLVLAEWDRDTPTYMAQTLMAAFNATAPMATISVRQPTTTSLIWITGVRSV